MALEDVARAHYTQQSGLTARAAASAAELWALLDPSNLTGSWSDQRLAERLFTILATFQVAAANAAPAYVAAALTEQGVDSDPQGQLVPQAVSGIASDGRPLESLVAQPLIGTLVAIRDGAAVDDALRLGGSALSMIAETQVADAGRAAEQVAMAVQPRVRGWIRMLVPPSCGRCAVLAGRFYRWNAGFRRHPRCFPAGTVVSGPATLAASRRWYEGELTVVRTASGKKLSVTGNHPVLTDRGWLPAHLLVEGDDVVGRPDGDRAVGLLTPDEDQVPARIEDVWRAGRMDALARVPVATEDFHGDGADGHVDVVPTYGLLQNRVQAVYLQQSGKSSLALRTGLAVALTSPSADDGLALGHRSSAYGSVGGFGLLGSLLGSHSAGAQQSGLAAVTDVHTDLPQASSHGGPTDAEAPRNGVLALSAAVCRGEGVDVDRQVAARWDAPATPFSMQSRTAYARVGDDLRLRLAGQVALDRVVQVDRVKWSGHVYNLTSREGWYCADGVIVSNCDCRHIPAADDRANELRTDPQAYFRSLSRADQGRYFTQAGAEAIRAGGDIAQVVNARRGALGLTPPGRLTEAEQRMLRGGRDKGYLQRVDVYGRQVYLTTEGTTRRGVAGQRLRAWSDPAPKQQGERYRRARTPRLMPESLLELAGDDKDELVRLLTRFGYVLTR